MTSRRVHASVAVLGNGPVGQTAALLLARWGVPVVLLDERPHREAVGSKSICHQRHTLEIWDSVGAGWAVADAGVTWRTARTFHRNAEVFSLDLPDDGQQRFPPFVNVSQSRVEQILDERIAAEPLVTVRWNACVTTVDQDADGITVHSADQDDVRADYAVACTGARSDGIRSCLGVAFEGTSFDDRFLICDIRVDLPGWAHERRFFFDPEWNPGRQVLIHPCPDGVYRIDWQVPSDYDVAAEAGTGALDRRIRSIVGTAAYELVWHSVYRFHSRVADRMRVGRVLLAGDCAHVFAPFGARGLNSGVADAENAAWKLAFALQGRAGDALLESYHDERHAAALENLAVTTATMDFLVPHGEAQRARRSSILSRAATDPAARGAVDSGRLAEPFWYDDSPLTTPDPTRPPTGRPPRGTVPPPRPGVPLPGGTDRTGFLLACADDVDPATVIAAADVPVRACRAGPYARPGEVWVVRPDAYVAGVTSADAARVRQVLETARGAVR